MYKRTHESFQQSKNIWGLQPHCPQRSRFKSWVRDLPDAQKVPGISGNFGCGAQLCQWLVISSSTAASQAIGSGAVRGPPEQWLWQRICRRCRPLNCRTIPFLSILVFSAARHSDFRGNLALIPLQPLAHGLLKTNWGNKRETVGIGRFACHTLGPASGQVTHANSSTSLPAPATLATDPEASASGITVELGVRHNSPPLCFSSESASEMKKLNNYVDIRTKRTDGTIESNIVDKERMGDVQSGGRQPDPRHQGHR